MKEEIEDEEAREQHRSDWIKAEYETLGWPKEVKPASKDEPLMEEKIK